MSDIFDEIDEEVRRDKMAAWWKKNMVFVILACVLTVGGVAGYKFWQNQQIQSAQETGSAYYAALKKVANNGDLKALDSVIAKYPDSVGVLAEFVKAQELAKTGKTDEAVALYNKISSTAKDTTFRQLALVRSGYLLIDTATLNELEGKLSNLNKADNPWRNNAREILGMSAWRLGEFKKAHDLFNLILADRGASPYILQRAQNMAALIAPKMK